MGEASKEMRNNLTATYIAWLVLYIGCMAVMIFFGFNKTIVIEDSSQVSLVGRETEAEELIDEAALMLRDADGAEGSFFIPIPKEIRAEEIILENRYLNRELCLRLNGNHVEFYKANGINGDILPITQAIVQCNRGSTVVQLKMERIYECQSTLEESALKIVLREPKDIYQRIVVLDPVLFRDETEAGNDDITLQIAKAVLEGNSDSESKIYLTRFDERESRSEDILAVLEEVGADFYVRIAIDSIGGGNEYGIRGIYNEEYFIPDFGNPHLADLLTREVTLSSGNRAVGLESADTDSILRQIVIPAAEVRIGNMSHPKEGYLLRQEAYQRRLAEGITEAIHKAFDTKDFEKLKE